MKYLILPIILAASITVACEITPTDLTPSQSNYYADLIEQRDAAEVAGDTRTVEETEALLLKFEQEVFRAKAGPVLAGINAILPAATPFSPLLLGLLPLASKRGRKHFTKGVKAVMPGVANPDGTKTMSPGEAIASVGRYLGMAHSSPKSEAAFEEEAT